MTKTTKTKRKGVRARPQTARKSARRRRANRTAARKAPAQFLPALPENESEDQAGAYGDERGETDLIQP
jgi:hypothetical protein